MTSLLVVIFMLSSIQFVSYGNFFFFDDVFFVLFHCSLILKIKEYLLK